MGKKILEKQNDKAETRIGKWLEKSWNIYCIKMTEKKTSE